MTESFPPNHQPGQTSRGFFGREAEVGWVNKGLARGESLLVIRGPHRIGKTTLLRRLARSLPDRYLAVYLDADSAGSRSSAFPLVKVAGEVVRHLRKRGVQVALPQVTSATRDALPAWRSYLEALAGRLDDQRLVLLVDNVEHASPDWLPVLLHVASSVVVSAQNHKALDELLPNAMLAPPSIILGPLGSEAAGDLVRALVTPKHKIDPWTVRRVVEVTSGHPHYIRLFCQVLLEHFSHKSPLMPPDAEETLRLLLDAPLAEFTPIWEGSAPREKVLLAIFAALRGQGGVATQHDLQKSFTRIGIPFPLAEIVATLDALVGRGVLERLGANSYRFALELLRTWIRGHHLPDQVIREEHWRFRKTNASSLFAPVLRLLSRRPTLWVSLALIAVVLLVVARQPALRKEPPEATATFAVSEATPESTSTPELRPTPSSAAVAPTPTPLPLLPGYDLAFMSRVDERAPWQIYAMNSATGSQLRLTETGFNERTPKWSPDGSWLLFASDRDGNREVYVMHMVAEGTTVNLTQHEAPDWQPSWSPDGRWVAFSSYRDENWEIYLIDAQGTNLERKTDHPESDFSPTWSPDGGKLLFASRRQGDADLFVLDLATDELTSLTSSQRHEYDPAWSPDGQWIAYVTQIGDQGDIYVMRTDGSDLANLTQSRYANDFQPVWAADSQSLIFVSATAADGDHDLFIMQRDGSQVRRLTDDDRDNVAPSQCPVRR